MADTIRMTLRAINWTEGEVGHVHLRMRPGECRVDWGDGRSDILRATTEGWYNVHHAYRESCKETEELFHISITASGDGLITGFVAGSGDMMVADVDLSGCPALEYLKADWLIERLDVTTNPGIKEMNLGGDAASLVDLSKFSVDYDEAFGFEADLHPRNIIDDKHFELKTPDVVIKVDPTRNDLIETRVIGGVKYIMICADEAVEVNGVNITIADEAAGRPANALQTLGG